MTRIKLGIICCVAVLAAALLLIKHQSQVKAGETDLSPQQPAEPSTVGKASQADPISKPTGPGPQNAAPTNQGPADFLAGAAAEGWVKNVLPKESWAFTGYASPRAALQTAFWALSKGDLESYRATLTPGERLRFEKTLQGPGQISPDFAVAAILDSQNISQLKLLYQEAVSSDQVILNVDAQGSNRGIQKAKFNLVGNEWKFDGFQP